jgi:nucleoside-triphosphatase THEP1
MNRIKILTGRIQSGKTTRITNWIKIQTTCAGVLSPVIRNLRYIYAIHSNQTRLLEVNRSSIEPGQIVRIGRYRFNGEIFKWAREEMIIGFKGHPDWFIIDEIGPLELIGKGLEPAVSKIFESHQKSLHTKLILVIREQLLQGFLAHYGILSRDFEFINL